MECLLYCSLQAMGKLHVTTVNKECLASKLPNAYIYWYISKLPNVTSLAI